MKTLISLLLMASVAFGQEKAAPKQGPPPKNLSQKADGHFSANEEPSDPEKFESYTVKAGDTLSSIAGQFLKDPKLWPQLWEENEHVMNPHWIYPNDKILIRPVTPIAEATPPQEPPPPPPAPQRPPVVRPAQPVMPTLEAEQKPTDLFDLAASKSAPEVKAMDLYCSGFVRAVPVPKTMKVTAKYNSDFSAEATEGDYVYISHGSEDGAKVGAIYDVVRATRKIKAPKSDNRQNRDLGMHYLDVAQVQVLMTQADFSMARVIHSCEPLEVGDVLLAHRQLSIPALPSPRTFDPFMKGSGQLKGAVAMTKSVLLNFGSVFRASGKIPGANSGELGTIKDGVASEGDIAYLDLGQDSGVKPGDVLIVFRPLQLEPGLYNLPKESKSLTHQMTAIGELVVLKVEDRAATALVTYSTGGILAGDSVERR